MASWSWRCHGNAEVTALGPGRQGQGPVPALLLSEPQWEGWSLAQPWLCMKMKPQSLSPCPAGCSLELGFTPNTKIFSLQP